MHSDPFHCNQQINRSPLRKVVLIYLNLAAAAEQEWLAAVVQEPEKPDPSERFRLRLKIQLVKKRAGHL